MSPVAYVTARPLPFGYSVPQEEGIAWMKAALRRVAEARAIPGLETALRLYDRLDRAAAIGARTTCLEDYTHRDWDRMRLLATPSSGDGQAAPDAAAQWFRPTLDDRMAVFAETAAALARDAFAGDAEAPDLLVQVSCTGYDSPNAAQRVAVEKEWTRGTRLLHLGHMGCYAALPAVALAADAVCALAAAGTDGAPDARAAILLVELCTLHHDPATTEVGQLVQQCLFADGAARVDVTAAPPAAGRALALLDYAEVLLPESEDAMTWRVADGAFRMTLSRNVPRHIESSLAPAVVHLLAPHGLGGENVKWWAVHPGGPRVIESAAAALGLPDEAVRHSHRVLFERGNMSSATVPHIWAAMLADDAVEPGDLIVSVAFGPGLTVAMSLMQVT